jgi:uncharacterized protein (DUF885 family)
MIRSLFVPGRNRPALLVWMVLIPATFLAATTVGEPGSGQTQPWQSMEKVIRLYETDRNEVSRFYDLPWSETRFDRMEKLDREWRSRLEALDFEALDQAGRIDYLLLRNQIEEALNRVIRDRTRLGEMKEFLPFRETVQTLERARWLMQTVDGPAAAGEIAHIADQVKRVRERLEKGRKAEAKNSKEKGHSNGDASIGADRDDSKTAETNSEPGSLKISASMARRTAEAVREIRGSLNRWFDFYDGYQPDFSWWLKKPHEDSAKALEDYAKYLREDLAGLKGKDDDPLVGDPIGPGALAEDIAAEMLPYSAEELVAIGEREFAWCEAEMKKASREMGMGDDWKAALARIKSSYVPPGQQDELVADLARQAIQFVKDRNLVTVPPLCEETWRLSMISPEGQKTLPFAAYGGQKMMVAYAREDMKHEDKLMSMRGNNRYFTRIVTAHELIPGHHLQRFMSARHHPYRSVFSTPFYVEGWSLYWEMLLWDQHFARTPEDRVGMLFWRLHRAARILVSLKFQLGRMKPAEMVDFLVDRVGHERFGATSEVRRFIEGSYSPLYQCGYMIGGLQLRALSREVVGAGKMTAQEFNDAVLTYGPIPIEMIRAGMLNRPLSKEYQPNWKFADELF